MKVALILLMALIAVGLPLYIHHRIQSRRGEEEPVSPETQPDETEQEQCCGMHITCERDSLLASVSAEIVYYDDEELDRHALRDPLSYTADEEEEFRDILLTMQPDDIAGWARSLQLRHIELPPAVREELIMIVSEARTARTSIPAHA